MSDLLFLAYGVLTGLWVLTGWRYWRAGRDAFRRAEQMHLDNIAMIEEHKRQLASLRAAWEN